MPEGQRRRWASARVARRRRSRPPSPAAAPTPATRTSTTSTSSSPGPSAAGCPVAVGDRPPHPASLPRATSTPAASPARSIARKAAALRVVPALPPRHGVIDHDPGASLRTPKGASRLPRVIRCEEAVDLLDDASDAPSTSTDDGDGDDPVAAAVVLRDLAVLEVLYGAGLRVAECCGLRIADCDLDRGLVTVLGKGVEGATGPDRRARGRARSAPGSTGAARARDR